MSMPDLSTSYMGIALSSPVVVAASSLSNRLETVRKAEEAGAGALVLRSLFEEQIALDRMRMEEELAVGAESFPEATTYFPEIEHGEASEHLHFVEKLRREVRMPLIGSVNAASAGTWTDYARRLEEAGVDGVELNVYRVETDPDRSSADVEAELMSLFDQVRRAVSVPVAVKLSPYYTALGNLARQLSDRGAAALVLFNRFLQPDIDLSRGVMRNEMPLSAPEEMRVPLRWTGLLHGRIGADIALNSGVRSGEDVVKALLAGATVVQVAATLIRNGAPYISTMLREIERWMAENGHGRLDDFRGRMSQRGVEDPLAYERAQYVGLLQAKARGI